MRTKTTRLKEKITKLKEQMQRLHALRRRECSRHRTNRYH